MDVPPLFAKAQEMLLTWGLYAVGLAIVFAFLRSAWFKGKLGEWLVNLAARLRLDKNTYHLIKDVTLPSGEGTTQIDHIIVSVFGVFVVETKNYRGWIFGSPKQKMWTQSIYRRKYSFQNPLHQNFKHVETLRELLQLDASHVHSVVVFVGDSTFKTAMPENVVYGGVYINYIRGKTTPVLSEQQVNAIRTAITDTAFTRSWQTNRAHRKHLQEKHEALVVAAVPPSINADEPLCPKCGVQMKLRTAQRGENQGQQFWGCSTYPKCRGMLSYASAQDVHED